MIPRLSPHKRLWAFPKAAAMLGLRPGCTNRFDIHIIAGVQLRVESWVRRALDEAARHRAVLALHASRIERRPDHLLVWSDSSKRSTHTRGRPGTPGPPRRADPTPHRTLRPCQRSRPRRRRRSGSRRDSRGCRTTSLGAPSSLPALVHEGEECAHARRGSLYRHRVLCKRFPVLARPGSSGGCNRGRREGSCGRREGSS